MKKLNFVNVTISCLLVFGLFLCASCSSNGKSKNKVSTEVQNDNQSDNNLKCRGVVYDVGLQYNPNGYSVETFNPDLVKYDMSVISGELHANTVRIEGEEISRLVTATEIAHTYGLKVFFNPWKMGANIEETIAYMKEAAIAAEKLRLQGIELVFVTGCEFSLFGRGIFQGETLNERIAYMVAITTPSDQTEGGSSALVAANEKLNVVLADICKVVREQFKGSVTYASGIWENVNWDLFDIVGVDYYRNGEPEQQYVDGLKRYSSSKPLLVMEIGSCAYEGAAVRGSGGFGILQGTNPDGTLKYEGGVTPVRSEKEQADYIETQLNILSKTEVDGVFIFVFAFPIMPYVEGGPDLDMTSYSLVKSFIAQDPRSQKIPSWEPKEAYNRLAEIYGKMDKSEE